MSFSVLRFSKKKNCIALQDRKLAFWNGIVIFLYSGPNCMAQQGRKERLHYGLCSRLYKADQIAWHHSKVDTAGSCLGKSQVGG